LMVRHRMLEKYGEFKVLRDEPIGPNRFRFVEYRLNAQGQPIVRPDAITKTNDYFVGGKRVAWYDRKTNKINVDSEAMQQWGITQPGLPAHQQDPVLKALWDSMTTTQEGALSEPSVPMRNIKTVLNFDVDEVGKVRYEAHPERQDQDIKSLLGAPSREKLLSRKLSNGEIEYYNPGKTERAIIKKAGLDQPGRERELDQFITRRRAWARQVMYLNQHGGQSPMEINNWLARDRIGTLGGYWNGSRIQTIYGMNGSGIMPVKSNGVWRNMRYTSVENLDVKLFGHSKYSAAEQSWREPVITPIITRAGAMRSEWQKNLQTVATFSAITTGLGAIYVAGRAIEATLKGQTQTRFLNTAPNEMLYGIDPSRMPQPSPQDMARIGAQLTGKPGADAAAMNLFSKGADGRVGLKGTTDLQREYQDAIKQYTAQSRIVTDLSLEVGRSAKPSGQTVDKLNQAIGQADQWLDRADLALQSRQMLLQLWSLGFQTERGETVVPRRDSVTPTYITTELRDLESTQATVVGYRGELQKNKQVALAAAQTRSDTLVTQSIASTNAQTAKQNLTAAQNSAKTAKDNLTQSKTTFTETQENNRRNQSRDAFSKWSAPIEAANTTFLRGYGDSASAAPRITIAGVQEVVLQPPIVNGVVLTLEQRLDNTLARVRTFPADGFYWARTQLGVSDAQLQQQLSGARQGLIDANSRFESQFGRRGGASPGGVAPEQQPTVAPNNRPAAPNTLPTIQPGTPLSRQPDPPSGVFAWRPERAPLVASSLVDSKSNVLLADYVEKKNEPALSSAPANKVSFSELTSAARQQSIQAQAATLEVLSVVRSRQAARGLPDITGNVGLSFLPLTPSAGFSIDIVNPSTGPLKKELDAKIAVAQAARVDVGAQVSLEVARHLNQAQIHRLQIERDSAKLRAIDAALADVQSRIDAGVARAADTVPLIEDKDKLNLSLSENQQSLEREVNTLAQLSGRPVSADSLSALKTSPGADFIAQQPVLPPFDSRTSGTDPETLIQQFANRQNTQVSRGEKEIDAADAALKYAQSQRKPKLSIGFSFPFIPSIRITGGNTEEVRSQIAKSRNDLDKARLTLKDIKLRNATEIRGAAGRARADTPNVNDSSWQQRIANADDLLFGSTNGATGARSGGLLAAYQQAVAAYRAGTASKADLLKPYLLLVDALHNRASSSLSLINDVATLRYAMGELDSAQEQTTLFKQLDGLLDPQARGTASVPVPAFGEMR
jgi:hypothetical protein